MSCKQRICDRLSSSLNMALFVAAISVSVLTSAANGQFSYDTSKRVWLGHHYEQTSTVIVPGAPGTPAEDDDADFVGSCTLITSSTTIFKTDTVGFPQSPGPLTNSTLDTADVTSLVGTAYLEVDADTADIFITMDTTAVGSMSAEWGQTNCEPCLSDPPGFELICGDPPRTSFLINESTAATCPEDLSGGTLCYNSALYPPNPNNCGNIMVPFTVTDNCGDGKRSNLRLFHANTFSSTDANTPQMKSRWIIVAPDGSDPELRTIVRGEDCGTVGQYVPNSGVIDQAGYFSNRITIPPGDYILVFRWEQVTLAGSVNANEMPNCATPAQKYPNVQVLAKFGIGILTCTCP